MSRKGRYRKDSVWEEPKERKCKELKDRTEKMTKRERQIS